MAQRDAIEEDPMSKDLAPDAQADAGLGPKLRHERRNLARERLRLAVRECREAGLSWKDILGTAGAQVDTSSR